MLILARIFQSKTAVGCSFFEVEDVVVPKRHRRRLQTPWSSVQTKLDRRQRKMTAPTVAVSRRLIDEATGCRRDVFKDETDNLRSLCSRCYRRSLIDLGCRPSPSFYRPPSMGLSLFHLPPNRMPETSEKKSKNSASATGKPDAIHVGSSVVAHFRLHVRNAEEKRVDVVFHCFIFAAVR